MVWNGRGQWEFDKRWPYVKNLAPSFPDDWIFLYKLYVDHYNSRLVNDFSQGEHTYYNKGNLWNFVILYHQNVPWGTLRKINNFWFLKIIVIVNVSFELRWYIYRRIEDFVAHKSNSSQVLQKGKQSTQLSKGPQRT